MEAGGVGVGAVIWFVFPVTESHLLRRRCAAPCESCSPAAPCRRRTGRVCGGESRGGSLTTLSTSRLGQTRFGFHVNQVKKGDVRVQGFRSDRPRQCGDVPVVGGKHQFYRWCVLIGQGEKETALSPLKQLRWFCFLLLICTIATNPQPTWSPSDLLLGSCFLAQCLRLS